MYHILERLQDTFLETEFKEYPFKVKDKDNSDLSAKFKEIISKFLDSQSKKKSNENNNKDDDNYIDIEFNKINYKLLRNPIAFQLFYETVPTFIAFEFNQFQYALLELDRYYIFMIDKKIYDINTIKNMERENKIKNPIIIVPLIFDIFVKLCTKINYENLKKSYFEINKELLEPFFIFIEKCELEKKIRNKKIENLNRINLETNITFFLNEERENFIQKLDDYASIDIRREPMIIIGNDGVGKTLTLQFYSLLELNDYKKFYFNIKLFEKCNHRDYFLIELMRGFISRNKTEHLDDFKNYIKCINDFQKNDFSDIKNIFKVLNLILNSLKFTGKYIIILDQFNFEKINMDDFNLFKRDIPYNQNFKLILCASLNDDNNKLKLFSDYENIELFKFLPEFRKENPLSNINNTNTGYNNIILEKNKNENGTSLNNFYLISKKRKRDSKVIDEENIINKDLNIKNFENNKEIDLQKVQKKKLRKASIDYNKSNNYEFSFSENFENIFDKINQENQKIKIYYNHLISLEDLFEDNNDSQDIIECMSYFNFIPKYYYKFNLLKIEKKIEGEKNIKNKYKSK